MAKVAICGEDLPIMTASDGTDQHVNWGTGHPSAAALVIRSRRLFVVAGIQLNIGKVAQVIADSQKLRLLADSRKHLLPRRSQKSHLAMPHEFIETLGNAPLLCGQINGSAT